MADTSCKKRNYVFQTRWRCTITYGDEPASATKLTSPARSVPRVCIASSDADLAAAASA